MRQLSSLFVVVGDTPTHTICEMLSYRVADGAAGIWRFAIEWDCDHDERIVQVVEHIVANNEMTVLGITRIGETRGTVVVRGRGAFSKVFPDMQCGIKNDTWTVQLDVEPDPIGVALGCGWRGFQSTVTGGAL